jgi:hypothetical protein
VSSLASATGTRAALSGSTVLLMTVLHHSYGAVRFGTPWRHHVSFVALLLGILLWGTLEVWRHNAGVTVGKFARGLFLGIALIAVVAWIGFFEGGYNHTLKIVLMMFGLPGFVFHTLYPPILYEAPGDWFFETTGVMQLGLAIWALRTTAEFARVSRTSR